jgi:hypothetical protein
MMSSSQKTAVGRASRRGSAASRASSMPMGLLAGIEAGLCEDAAARRLAQVEGGGVEAGGEVTDPPVAEPEEMPEGRCRTALGVEPHRRPPGRLGLHEDDVGVRAERLRRADLEEQIAVDGSRLERLEALGLPAAVVGGVHERNRVPG